MSYISLLSRYSIRLIHIGSEWNTFCVEGVAFLGTEVAWVWPWAIGTRSGRQGNCPRGINRWVVCASASRTRCIFMSSLLRPVVVTAKCCFRPTTTTTTNTTTQQHRHGGGGWSEYCCCREAELRCCCCHAGISLCCHVTSACLPLGELA